MVCQQNTRMASAKDAMKPMRWTGRTRQVASLQLLVCASICVPAIWSATQAPAKRPTPRALLAGAELATQQNMFDGGHTFLPEALQQQQQQAAGLEDPALDRPAGASGDCQRLLWFMCLGGQATGPESRYLHFLKTAVLSARRHAPSLVPVLVYGGQPDTVTQWFEEHGGTVIFHTLSFLPDLQRAGNETWSAKLVRMQGAFLRLDIPLVVERIEREGLVDLANTSTRYALYTDVDAMFLGGSPSGTQGDLSTCTLPLPSLLGFGPERWKGEAKNSGVLLFNVPAMARELPAMLEYGRARKFELPAWDQGLLRFYTTDLNKSVLVLPDRLNWKAYWGPNPEATILHWHGAKPGQCLPCLLQQRGKPDWRRVCSNCPPRQLDLWADVPDGGKFYGQMTALFNSYWQQA